MKMSKATKKPVNKDGSGGGSGPGIFNTIGSFFDGKPGNSLFGGSGTYHGAPSDQPSYQDWVKSGKKPPKGGWPAQAPVGEKPGSWAGGDAGKPGSGGYKGGFDKPGKFGGAPQMQNMGPGSGGAPAFGGGGLFSGGGSAPNIGSAGGGFGGAYAPPNLYAQNANYGAPPANTWDGNNFVITGLQNQPAQQPPVQAPPPVQTPPPAQAPAPAPQPQPQPQPGQGGFDLGNIFDAIQPYQEQIRGVLGIPDQTPQVDLAPIMDRLGQLEQSMSQPAAAPQPVSFDPIMDRLNQLEARLPDSTNQPVAAPEPVNFDPVLDRIGRVEQALERFGQTPQPQAPNPWGERDPQEIIGQMLDERLSNIPQPQTPSLNVDLSPIQNDLAALTDRLNSFRQPEIDYSRINEMVGQQVGDLRNSLPSAPQPVSFDPILDRIGQLEQRFEAQPAAAMPEIDLNPIMERLGGLEQRFEGFQPTQVDYNQIGSMLDNRLSALPRPSTPQPVSLDPIMERLGGLEQQFRSFQPPQVDLSGIQNQIAGLGNRLDNMPQVDLSGLNQQVGQLQNQFQNFRVPEAPQVDYNQIGSMLDERLSALPQPAAPQQVNLNPIMERLGGLEQQFSSMPQPQQVDLSGINQQIGQLQNQFSNFQPQQSPQVDYSRINQMIQEAMAPQSSAYQTIGF